MSEQSATPTDLSISEFMPRPALVTAEHHVARARFPAIDIHNHLGRWLTAEHQWGVQDVPSLLGMMEYCNLSAIVNLDGMWGDELEANLDRYDRAYPGRFFTFAHCDWNLVTEPDFGKSMARQLADSVRRGARGLKVWKTLGLHYRDGAGKLIPIDDPRLFDLWEAAGDSSVPVLIHIADPVAFFQPLDHTNERWEELHAHPDWHFPSPEFPSFEALIEQFERLIAEHPRTTFIGAHVGCYAENLAWVGRMLDTYPNFYVDISARLAELGRQPYAARRFFVRHAGRVAFGLDGYPPAAQAYAPYFRFLETADEYFPYSPTEPGRQGRWRIYGIDLEEETLRRIYYETAARMLGLAPS